MPSTINADNGVVSGSSGVKTTADTSGVLALQSNGSTGISLGTDLSVTFAGAQTLSAGTANGVAYLNGSKVLTSGSALTFDGTNLAVTQSGNPTMTVKTTGAGNNPLYRLQADTNYWDALGVFSDSNDTLRFRYNGTDYLTLTNAGAIGVGSGISYGTSGQVLTSGGSSAAPTWTTPAAGGFSNMTVFASSGTWTVPAGITKCKVTVVGAGGSGGCADVQIYYAASGGGGGGAAIGIVTLSGGSATITVGTGGASVNTSRATGNTGGTSSFVYSATTVSATGGAGGTANDNTPSFKGGTGGVGSGGDLNISGQGGQAGSMAAGLGALRASAGHGGSSILGGGGWSIVTDSATAAGAGGSYGGGGGAANRGGASGAGAVGVVIIEF